MLKVERNRVSLFALGALTVLGGCAGSSNLPDAPSSGYAAQAAATGYARPQYGPGAMPQGSPYGASYGAAGYNAPAYGAGPTNPQQRSQTDIAENYIIGALDELTIFVWRNPELGSKVQVRPDGRITTPLITDMPAAGKTPTQLANDIKVELSKYINEPLVNVIVSGFAGNYQQQIQIIGATEKPASLNYRANMTLLDALIAVGGLSEFASGNRARLSRLDRATGTRKEYRLRIDDLLEKGDMRANVELQPGDVITIPTSMF